MAFSLPAPKFDTRRLFAGRNALSGLAGRILLGLGLGSFAAAAYAAIYYFRRTAPSRALSRTDAATDLGPYAPREEASMDWIVAGRGMDTLTPAAYSIPGSGEDATDTAKAPPFESAFTDPAPDAGSALSPDPSAQEGSYPASLSRNEPWIDTVRRAMEKKPLSFGYDKSAWTAPLLSQYLMETLGVTVPVPRLRNALKDMGYHWKHTHYVQARPGKEGHH